MALRETADGWVDLDRASFQRSGGRDLPDMTPNTREILVDGDGSGVLLGGVSDASTAQSYIGGVEAPTARRRALGAPARPRRARRARARPGVRGRGDARAARFRAPRGRRPSGLPGPLRRRRPARATRPTRTCGPRSTASGRWSAGGAGPAALLIGGGRASVGGEPLDLGGARRYRELTQGAGVPTYVLPGPGDLPNGGAEAFAAAFASAPAPQGTGDAPAGVDTATVAAARGRRRRQARNTFAFDVRAAAGTVRVIAIDNAAGRLAGGTDGAQAQWIRDDAGAGARGTGIPSIVVGSMPLDASQAAKPAADAAEEIALLAGHASAYVATAGVDDPTTSTSAARWPRASSRRPAAPPRSRCCSPRRSATRRPRTSDLRRRRPEERSPARRAPRC